MVPTWSANGLMLDDITSIKPLASRVGSMQDQAMATTKQRSDRLKAAMVAARPPKVPAAVTRRLVAALNDPTSGKEPVYTWLLVNFDQVLKARTRWDGLRWDSIARVMVEDGIVGSRGEPPNANSVRRVWDRVVRDKEKRDARKTEQSG